MRKAEASISRIRPRTSAPFLVLTVILTVASTSLSGASRGLTLFDDPSPAPELRLSSLDGSHHTLSQYRGRAVIVHFWATWCVPCREEMPDLQTAWEQVRPSGVQILAVAVGDSRNDVEAFVSRVPLDFPVLLDESKEAFGRWPALGLPTTFFVNPTGSVVGRIIGSYAWDQPEYLDKLPLSRRPRT